QVTASSRPSRTGGEEFGLLVSSVGSKPFTDGVPGLALNCGSPGLFAALGYVPKEWSDDSFSGKITTACLIGVGVFARGNGSAWAIESPIATAAPAAAMPPARIGSLRMSPINACSPVSRVTALLL